MDKPKIADTKPAVLEVAPGSYWWCRCGASATQPYCDGSHTGTSFTPLEVKVEEKRKIAFCNCKHTGKEPHCDGAHARL